MKKLYILILLFVANSAIAQIVNIPDANFKAKLVMASTSNTIARGINGALIKIDANSDSQIQLSEALTVYQLDVKSSQIADLTGIEAFTNLKKLNCKTNLLTSLDLSALTNLTEVICYANDIVTLNTTNLSSLVTLDFHDNEVITWNSTGLTSLSILEAWNNKLTSVSLTALSSLTKVDVKENKLTSLSVAGLPLLNHLNCSANFMTNLDASAAPALQFLYAMNNNLTSMNVIGCTALENLNCSSNMFTSLSFSGFSNLKSLDSTTNQLTSLTLSGLPALTSLNCGENNLSSLGFTGADVPMLSSLECSFNQFTTLDLSSFSSINTLRCSFNQLTSLTLNNAVKQLFCPNNQLTTLNNNNLSNLTYLDCGNNLLTNLNLSAATTLFELFCNNNLLTSLTFGSPTMERINCSYNQLTALNVPVANIDTFDCSHNLLTSLTVADLNAFSIDCSYNLLTSLNVGCPENLYCDHNLLTAYTACSSRLRISYNQLTSLTFNSTETYEVDCSHNLLTTLKPLYIYDLNCSHNNLVSIDFKNNYLEEFSLLQFSGNPTLQYVCADENELYDIQQVLDQLGYTSCEVNSYCSFTPGGTFYTIQGNDKLDINSNGCDAGDQIFPNLKFSIANDNASGTIIPDASGNYSIRVQHGTHTLTPMLENANYFTVTPTSATVTFPGATVTQNFCIAPNGIHSDLEITVMPIASAIPGFDSMLKIIYRNKGTHTQTGSVSFAFDSTLQAFLSATPIPDTQTTGTLNWNFTNLLPFETREIALTFNLNTPMETPPVNGDDVLHFTAAVTSASTDETPADNTFTLNQTVVNSFDPNDKTCLEGKTITPEMVGQYVHYMIRFENTGTANAQRVIVTDRIDTTKFDISSLVAIRGSHQFVTRVFDGNKVEFIFENINLPFDDANNDGYVVFKIKTLPTLSLNDTFTNSAAIYFDYNFPIFTEPAVTTVQLLGIDELEKPNPFTLHPNPASGLLNIIATAATELKSVSIFNMLGQLVMIVPDASTKSALDVSRLAAGNYVVKLTASSGIFQTKLVKN